MTLTTEEAEFLQRAIRREERRWVGWGFLRWFWLACAAVSIGAGVWLTYMISGFSQFGTAFEHGTSATMPVTRGEMLGAIAWRELVIVAGIGDLVCWVIGVWMLAWVLSNWNRGRVTNLLGRLAREKREEIEGRG